MADFIFGIGDITIEFGVAQKYPALLAAGLTGYDSLYEHCANRFETLLKFCEVRPRPVNLAASRAAPEFFVIDFCKRLKFLDYITLGDPLEPRIATEATRERSYRVEQVKTADHLDCLRVGMLRPRTVTMSND